MRFKLPILLLATALAGACEHDITVNVPTPTQFGNAREARIRYSNPLDGLNQTTTTMPFTTSFTTDRTAMFISLDVTPISFGVIQSPFMSAQIVVNDFLFREATSSDFLLNTLSVSGTWRK